MNYTKPQVAVLGEAVRVIEQRPLQGKQIQSSTDSPTFKVVNPAYDLDE